LTEGRQEVQVRAAEPSDAEALHRIFSGPKAISGTLQLPYPTVELWRKRLSEVPEGSHQLVAVVAGDVVGELTLWTRGGPRTRHTGSFGMAVRDDWQGRGVGSALMKAMLDLAESWLGLTRVELTVYTDNEPAIALYRKFGFEVEGTHRRYALRDGEYVDAHSMARLL
jgi:putative acetyltransferase